MKIPKCKGNIAQLKFYFDKSAYMKILVKNEEKSELYHIGFSLNCTFAVI